MAGLRAAVEQPALTPARAAGTRDTALATHRSRGRVQAGTGTPLIATLTTTTGPGACRRHARAYRADAVRGAPGAAQHQHLGTVGVIEQHPRRQTFRDLHGHRGQGRAPDRPGHLGLEPLPGVQEIFPVLRGIGVRGVGGRPLRGVLPGPHHVQSRPRNPASRTAQRSAAREADEPSTPTTMRGSARFWFRARTSFAESARRAGASSALPAASCCRRYKYPMLPTLTHFGGYGVQLHPPGARRPAGRDFGP